MENYEGRGRSGRDYWIAGASITAGVALGLTIMYLFDPDRGKRRRHQLRDQTASKLKHLQKDFAGKLGDVAHRAQGAMHSAVSGLSCVTSSVDGGDRDSDDLIRDRVRSQLGHLVPRENRVEAEVKRGIVALRGTLPAPVRDLLVQELRTIRGVRDIDDFLATPA